MDNATYSSKVLINKKEQKGTKKIIYKTKDFPPNEDIETKLNEYYKDFMANIPLPLYTTRQGILNLVSYLIFGRFLVPELGSMLYMAYRPIYGLLGSLLHATTPLHLDVSDAVNVMVVVKMLKEEDEKNN